MVLTRSALKNKDQKKETDVNELFLKGVAISTWQNSSDENLSNWTRYSYKRWPFQNFGLCLTHQGPHVGKSCDFWERYREDIELAAKIGSNTFRFSFEWGRIEPRPGQFDESAIKRFHEMLDCMEEHGIEPNATLHHFTHPIWFEDLGAFAKKQNSSYFIRYAVKVFKEFSSRIKLWATFNEPTCYIFLAYIAGMAPPGHVCNLPLAGQALSNLLDAHVDAYHAMKACPGGALAQIGLVHHHITFSSRRPGNVFHFGADWAAKWAEYWWGWDVMDHWMHTGEFEWKLPFYGTWIKHKDRRGKPPCDWWGINMYSRPVLSWHFSTTCFPGQVMTDMYYPIYAEGLKNAIVRSAKYNIPMYITETGCADRLDDGRRAAWIDSYMKVVLDSIGEGYDVRGFYYWTLMDNFEWAAGYTMRFGLYRWEADGSVDRVLREGGKLLAKYFFAIPEKIEDLKALAVKAKKSTWERVFGWK